METLCFAVQNLPGKMIDHFGWFHHFLKPIHHFTGASFFRVKLLLFGSPSFYRNIILLEQLCPPNSSPSFYELTFKKFNGVHHFTGSLLLHWNYRNQQIFSHKTRWWRTERALSVGKQYYRGYSIYIPFDIYTVFVFEKLIICSIYIPFDIYTVFAPQARKFWDFIRVYKEKTPPQKPDYLFDIYTVRYIYCFAPQAQNF